MQEYYMFSLFKVYRVSHLQMNNDPKANQEKPKIEQKRKNYPE